MARLVHVIGAGLAGLAAAVQLQRRGARVVLHEAADQAGGRCRSYYDRVLGVNLDSGNHFVLSGHHATLGYLRAIGASDELVGPAQPEFAFMDLATRSRWTLRLSRGRLPWWIFDGGARVPGTRAVDYLSLLPLLFAKPGRTMAQTMRSDGLLWERLVRPFFRAVLNVEPREGSAELAGAVAREALAGGGDACRPLVAKNGLGSAFVDPALRLLQHGGAQIRLGSRLTAISFDDTAGRASALDFDGTPVPLDSQDAVVLAVPPDVARTLVPGIQTPQRFRAVVNAHFAVEPPPGLALLTGLVNSTAEWLFGFDGRLSVTINGADRLLDMPREELARSIWADVAQVTSLPPEPMPAWQIVAERHATFAAVPQEEMRRPATRTRWNNLMLAGDWVATGLPATIEGAIRSGQKAADTLFTVSLEHR
ncbi:hypothetical protein CY652_00145 [Burkholderia sp. WAC0059]|uniref:hydroxysqualene dehydroxylase HpnE n=1 Tax=Burkholderia sp. WAC0059 TaxID=2066022 RepID=UPI000C7F60FE|nr:hydroxysqualene dehydroxylase HpnE [Burkholderia sp. WAC0059]PLZ04139.1 hypothetical protein CY652_00145 [Burkholderia sp. WAC0059]